MDDISELLLGPQRSPGPTTGMLLAAFAVLIAGALLGYFGWCYFRERQIRKRIRERVKRRCGGNVVPRLPVPTDPKRRREESAGARPLTEHRPAAVRRRRHPWKRRNPESPTPH